MLIKRVSLSSREAGIYCEVDSDIVEIHIQFAKCGIDPEEIEELLSKNYA